MKSSKISVAFLWLKNLPLWYEIFKWNDELKGGICKLFSDLNHGKRAKRDLRALFVRPRMLGTENKSEENTRRNDI